MVLRPPARGSCALRNPAHVEPFRRGGAGQVIIGAVVFAIIIVFVLEFRAGRQATQSALSRDCAVKVMDRCVDRKEYFASFGLIVPRGVPQKKIRAMGLRRQVAEGLVERELLLSEAERLGVSISEKEIDDELATGKAHVSIPVGQVSFLSYSLGIGEDGVRELPVKSVQTEAFDYKIYERVVRNTTNRSPKEFKEMQRRELIAARVRDLVRARVRVSVKEAEAQWTRERSKAVARIVHVDKAWFAKYAVDTSDAAMEAWAKENPQQLDEAWKADKKNWTAGCLLVSEILVPVDPETPDENKVDLRKKIEDAAARLKNKEPFDLVARDLSQGSSATWGGEVGCLGEGYGVGAKELGEAAAKMKPGEVSPVLETARGFHILRLDGKLAESSIDKVGRLANARRLAVALEADALTKKFADEVIERAQKGDKLEDVVKELSRSYLLPHFAGKKDEEPKPLSADNRPRVEISAPFNEIGGPSLNTTAGENPAHDVFALDKVDAVVKKPLTTDTGLAVLQLKEKTMAKHEDFEKDRVDVLDGLRAAKARDAISRYIVELRDKAKDKILIDPRILEEGKDDESDGS